MTALTDNELQAINNRCEAATPGPFTIIEPIQAEDEDGNCIHGAYSYPGGIEDANGDAVCTFGSENGSGHMFEHKANKVFLSNARTDIPALLSHIEHQRRALEHMATQARNKWPKVAGAPRPDLFTVEQLIQESINATKESTC